jgi:hypothetical protein
MVMLQVWVGITKEASSSETALAELQLQMRKALEETRTISIVDMAVRTEANIDPAALSQLTTLIEMTSHAVTAAAGAVGAGVLLLEAIRKFVTATGALIHTVRVEIGGRPVALDQVTAAELDQELAKK